MEPRQSEPNGQPSEHVLHTGQRLKDISPECLLKVEDLETVLKSIEELRQTVEELDISEVARHKLRQRCVSLRQAVEEYSFWGVDGIEVSFEATKGAMLPHVQVNEKGVPTVPWLKICQIVLAISNVLGLANTGYKNAHDSFLLLESAVHVIETHAGTTIEAIERKLPD